MFNLPVVSKESRVWVSLPLWVVGIVEEIEILSADSLNRLELVVSV